MISTISIVITKTGSTILKTSTTKNSRNKSHKQAKKTVVEKETTALYTEDTIK